MPPVSQRATRPRGEGQWALGRAGPAQRHRAVKKDDDGLNVRPRILDPTPTRASTIDPADLRGRMRWMGLYTQRAPGIPGGKTALAGARGARGLLLHAAGAHRRRRSSPPAAAGRRRHQHRVRPRHRRRHRPAERPAALDPHRGRPGDLAAAGGVGLQTTEACGDTPRGMLNCPLAGVAADEVLDASDVLAETVARTSATRFTNLPRKWKTVDVAAAPTTAPSHEIDDVSFVGVLDPDGEAGLRPVGRRRAVDQPHARPAARRLRPARPGDRRLGGVDLDLPRLRLPPAAQPRADEVPDGRLGPREVPPGAARTSTSAGPLPDGPAAGAADARPARPRRRAPAEGRRQRVGLRAAHRPAQRHAAEPASPTSPRVRRRPDPDDGRSRSWSSSTSPTSGSTTLVAALAEHDLRSAPSAFRRGTMACTGLEFCKLAIVETKARAHGPVRGARAAAARLRRADQINVNGCPNTCARFQTRRHRPQGLDGPRRRRREVEGFQVHLGGHLGLDGCVRPQAARAQDHQGRDLPDYSSACCAATSSAREPGRVLRDLRAPRRRRAADVSEPKRAAPPFHCPYCGDEDLVPAEDRRRWRCRSCLRIFAVRHVGIGDPPAG